MSRCDECATVGTPECVTYVAELEAKLAAAMGALQSLRDKCAREGWVEGMFVMIDANKALADEPPALKRYRAIVEAAKEGAAGCIEEDVPLDSGCLYPCCERMRQICAAVRGEVTDGE